MADGFNAKEAFQQMVRDEQEKARTKYGEIGLLPGGDPERDIYDYAAHEIVGLLRYGEMVENRAYDLHVKEMFFVNEANQLRVAMAEFAMTIGPRLLYLRNAMQQAGYNLGTPEGA
jgi:hypothetical protein